MHWALGFRSLDINSRRSLYFWHYQSMFTYTIFNLHYNFVCKKAKRVIQVANGNTTYIWLGIFVWKFPALGIRYGTRHKRRRIFFFWCLPPPPFFWVSVDFKEILRPPPRCPNFRRLLRTDPYLLTFDMYYVCIHICSDGWAKVRKVWNSDF